MAKAKEFRILVATDGSDHARAAIATAVNFPWPARSRVRAVVARKTAAEYRRSMLLAALDRAGEIAAASARRALSRRWPDVEVVVVDKTPLEGILAEAESFAADLIVLGWRGHGPVRRVLMGTVSRSVARRTSAAVLVVGRRRRVRGIVVGLDESAGAQHALAFVGRLLPPRGGRVTLVTAITRIPVPSRGFGARAVAGDVRRANKMRRTAAQRALNRAAAGLKRKGWNTRTVLATGESLRELLRAVGRDRADLMVVGARASRGMQYLLLGSVAEGAVNHSPVPVVVARR